MPQSKQIPKERYTRQHQRRAIRRALADILPDNSNAQRQSPLFSFLPEEIRFLIFQHVLSQIRDHDRPIDIHSTSPLYRPGHSHHTTVDPALLQTCRLIYYEAHAIPLRSTTHHFRYLGSTSWLHHITKQRGAELYHLHNNLVFLTPYNFSKFFLPHLKWRRVTWTVCAYIWSPILSDYNEYERLTEKLSDVVLPESCQEVTLELETKEDLLDRMFSLRDQAKACRQLALSRSDGAELAFDDSLALQYRWAGSGRWCNTVDRESKSMDYHTIRLCWRAQVARREYMSYDRLDCLSMDECVGIKKVSPLDFEE